MACGHNQIIAAMRMLWGDIEKESVERRAPGGVPVLGAVHGVLGGGEGDEMRDHDASVEGKKSDMYACGRGGLGFD